MFKKKSMKCPIENGCDDPWVFTNTNSSSNIKITKNGTEVTFKNKDGGGLETVRGNTVLNKGKHYWEILIDNLNPTIKTVIGIGAENEIHNGQIEKQNWLICTKGYKWWNIDGCYKKSRTTPPILDQLIRLFFDGDTNTLYIYRPHNNNGYIYKPHNGWIMLYKNIDDKMTKGFGPKLFYPLVSTNQKDLKIRVLKRCLTFSSESQFNQARELVLLDPNNKYQIDHAQNNFQESRVDLLPEEYIFTINDENRSSPPPPYCSSNNSSSIPLSPPPPEYNSIYNNGGNNTNVNNRRCYSIFHKKMWFLNGAASIVVCVALFIFFLTMLSHKKMNK